MAAPMNQEHDGQLCEIEATVATGFEPMAKEEASEKLGVDATIARGKINFLIPVNNVKQITNLQSVDNLFVIIKRVEKFSFAGKTEDDIEVLTQLVPGLNWELGLCVWKQFIPCDVHVSHLPVGGWEDRMKSTDDKRIDSFGKSTENCKGDDPEIKDSNSLSSPPPKKAKKENDPTMPSFRATCYRTGDKHSFQSPLAATHFGGAVQDYFCWNVNLKNFDIEVVLFINSDSGYVGLGLTKESLHKRHLTQFAPTTLRPTLAYNILRLCKIQPGDVVVDPMCGGGSIPVEGAVNWPKAKHICGDIHPMASPKCQANVMNLNERRLADDKFPIKVDIFSWDVTRLPLRDKSVDVFVTDLPFGKRSGSLVRNLVLYPRTLGEMARCTKLETGRACLLTQDKKCITKNLRLMRNYWSVASVVGINIGGLAAAVWCLHRTATEYTGMPKPSNQKKDQQNSSNAQDTSQEKQV